MNTLLRRRQMMGTSEVHPDVVFYDRLVFDGTAYIETDIIPPVDASFRVTLGHETIQGAQRLFMNACANSAYTGITITGTVGGKRTMNIYYCSSSAAFSGLTLSWSYKDYTLYMTPKKAGVGDDAGKTLSAGNNAPSGGVLLGTNVAKNGQPFSGRMGRFLIYGSDAKNATGTTDLLNNYTPVYDLRPCTYNGEAGLWCMETSKFYGNTAGAGALSVMNNS